MSGVLADANFEGQLQRLIDIWNAPEWQGFSVDLNLEVASFADLGLEKSAPDQLVWRACQSRQLVLSTGNRKQDDSTSLEATIRNESQADSSPVFTIGTVERLLDDRDYAHRVAADLFQYLVQIRENPEIILGAGRLDLPKSHKPIV